MVEAKKDGALSEFLTLVDRLPFIGSLKNDVTRLRALLYDRRAPRLVAIGRRGSGRTTLLHALLSRPAMSGESASGRWVHIEAAATRLHFMELDAGAPAGMVEPTRELCDAPPDVVLLVHDATSKDGKALDDVVEALARVDAALTESRGVPTKTSAICVLTRLDLLAAGEEPPLRLAESRLAAAGRSDVPVLAVGARAEWDKDGALVTDARQRVDVLSEAIFEKLPDAARVEGARALPAARDGRRRTARAIVAASGAVALTVGLAPLPFADAFVLVPLQGLMVSSIAHVSGKPWDARTIGEWAASLGVMGGAGFGFRWAAQQIVKLIPGAGSVISASVAAAGTVALGHSAIAYFVDGVSLKDAKKLFARRPPGELGVDTTSTPPPA